jgi:hypothetical protein
LKIKLITPVHMDLHTGSISHGLGPPNTTKKNHAQNNTTFSCKTQKITASHETGIMETRHGNGDKN